MPNPFVHIESQTQDVDKAKKFYKGLFDWKVEDFSEMAYTMIDVGDGTGGGMMKNPVPGAPSHWIPYALVDDIKASTKKAKSLSGRIVMDITEIPDYGWFSVIVDPTEATFGLWQAKAGK